jgi:CHAD domain-containing protein
MIQNTGNKLEKAIARQVEKTEYFCTAENVSPNLAVHELRKTFKRLRAWLRFYRNLPGINAEQAIEEIRHFGKDLAPLRESFVNINLFEKEMMGHQLIPERKMRIIRGVLISHNKLLTGESLYNNTICGKIRNFFSDFDTYLNRGENIRISKLIIYRELSSSYLKSFMRFKRLTDESPPEDFHSLRKKLKRLYYQLDFIRFIHPRYFKLKTDQLNRINDQLGRDHDLFVFIKEMSSEDYDFNSEELFILDKQVEYLRDLNRMKLYPRLKQFFIAVPEEFDQKVEQFFKL